MGRNGESKKWERREAQGKIEDHSGICRERERLRKIERNREKKGCGVLVAFNSRNSAARPAFVFLRDA
uniref:Uncharacterized protein n=1 Tax=Cucumis melo TaxID=3656 RepID=A0A9I9DTW4_CUCME